MMTRAEALRKCLIVFDALRRVSSKGNAGLEPLDGAEESFRTDSEICRVLREWLREMESGAPVFHARRMTAEEFEEIERKIRGYSPLEQILEPNGPLITEETIEAARRVDEAQEKLIRQTTQPEPDVPKVVDLREWQRLAAKKPPERLDFDEE